MRVGTAWKDITPDRPLPLIGQMYERIGEYTRDPLTANAVVFANGQTRVAVVSVDVCALPDAYVRSVQQACACTLDIDAEAVLILATHTHVGSFITDRFVATADAEEARAFDLIFSSLPATDHLVERADRAFMTDLQRALVRVVGDALDDCEECELFADTGYIEQMGWNRRGMRRDGSCHMYWGSWKEDFVGIEGPRDGEVPVLFARKADGSVKVVVCSFATHPNCLEHGIFYSADLPGEVRRVLRGALGQETGVVYLTGAAGNTAPTIMENNSDDNQPWRNEAGVVRSGLYLGGEILKVIAGRIEPMVEPVLQHEWTQLDIPMREWDSWCDPADYGDGMRQFFEISRAQWPQLMQDMNPVPIRVHALRIGAAAICFNPAELYVEFGLAIKQASPAQVTLIGELADGYCGYVPTPEAIRHGGYSAASASHTRLVPEGGWIMVEETCRLLAKAFSKAASEPV